MKLLLSGAKLNQFCEIVSNIKNLCEFITFQPSEERLYSQGMSGDHCAIYELDIGNEWFDDYELDKNDSNSFSVSTEMLAKIIHTRQPNQYMVIEYNGKSDMLTIRFANNKVESKSKVNFPKEFSLSMIDVDYKNLTIPDVVYSVDFGIDSKTLNVMNDQLSMFDETLQLHCDEDNIYFKTKGIEGEMKVTLFSDSCENITEYSIEEDLTLFLEFSNKHFSTFCKFLKVSDNIKLSFSDKYPMLFDYVFEDEDISLVFYLAPKISD